MMLYPPVAELVEKIGSRYQLVNLVARWIASLSPLPLTKCTPASCL